MKKLSIGCVLFFLIFSLNAQNNEIYFHSEYPGCIGLSPCLFPYSNIDTSESGIDYGCLSTHPYPDWFVIYISESGNALLNISSPEGHDLDFACWGPFPYLFLPPNTSYFSDQCVSCPNNTDNPQFYPSGNLIDCSYSVETSENLRISNALTGQYYYLMVSHANNVPGHISLTEQTPVGAMAEMNGAFIMIENNTVSACDSANNFYNLFIHYYIGTGGLTCICPDTLTITDLSTGNSSEYMASLMNLTLDSLIADGQSHTFVVNWANNFDTLQIMAPPPCFTDTTDDYLEIDSIALYDCNSNNNYYSVSLYYSISTALPCICPDTLFVTELTGTFSEIYPATPPEVSIDSLTADGELHTFVLDWEGNSDTVSYTAPESCDTTTSVGLFQTQSLSVSTYPNPFSSELSINIQSMPLNSLAEISVIDSKGKTVYLVSTSDKATSIPTKNLNAGLYLVRVNTGKETATVKLFKE